MTASSLLTTTIAPIVKDYADDDLLLIGSVAATDTLPKVTDTIERLVSASQLSQCKPAKLAIISDLIEDQNKTVASQLLGLIRDCYAGHIILITSTEAVQSQGWQLTDFLSLGFKLWPNAIKGYTFYSYNIKSYQPKHDWLNSRFWANPEQFGKHRW